MSSVAGRGVFTAAAAFALIGGGTGMAFAGEATDSASTADHHGDHDKGHDKGHHKGDKGHGHDGKWGKKKHDKCEIPIVDDAVKTGGDTLNDASHDATKPVLEAGDKGLEPVHDAVCPPLSDILGGEHMTGAPDVSKDAAPSAPQGAPTAMAPRVG